MKVLVVDDSVSVRKALERILSTRQIKVVATGSGEEALQKLPGSNPALVIADVVMPGMDGFTLCAKIKADRRYGGVPVLLISGIVNPDVIRQAAEAGAADIVKKPFTPDDLFPKIERALAGAAPHPDAFAADVPTEDAGLHRDAARDAARDLARDPAQALTPAGRREALAALLGPLLENAAVDAALVADGRGTLLAQAGRAAADDATLAVYSRTLASVAGVLGTLVGAGELGSLHLEYAGQNLLITKLADRGTLLLSVKDASSLGVARYLVRKFAEGEAALAGVPALAVQAG